MGRKSFETFVEKELVLDGAHATQLAGFTDVNSVSSMWKL
jgi:hypothetical protein